MNTLCSELLGRHKLCIYIYVYLGDLTAVLTDAMHAKLIDSN